MSKEPPKKGGRPRLSRNESVTLAVRISKDMKDTLETLAARAEMTLPDFLRAIMFSWLVLQYDLKDEGIVSMPNTWEEFYKLWGAHFVLMGHRAYQQLEFLKSQGAQPDSQLPPNRLEKDFLSEKYRAEFDKFYDELWERHQKEMKAD